MIEMTEMFHSSLCLLQNREFVDFFVCIIAEFRKCVDLIQVNLITALNIDHKKASLLLKSEATAKPT